MDMTDKITSFHCNNLPSSPDSVPVAHNPNNLITTETGSKLFSKFENVYNHPIMNDKYIAELGSRPLSDLSISLKFLPYLCERTDVTYFFL